MKFNLVLLVFLSILFTACTSNTIYKKPANLIPEAQMVDLLTDMYIAVSAKHVKTKDLQNKVNYMPLVYEKYGIDSLRFQTSNIYYMSRIDDYEAIYKKVEKRLIMILDTTDAGKKVRDSISKINRKNTKKEKILQKKLSK